MVSLHGMLALNLTGDGIVLRDAIAKFHHVMLSLISPTPVFAYFYNFEP